MSLVQGCRAFLCRLSVRRWDAIVAAIAIAALAGVFYANTMVASRVIDGTRYFWLDDDMMISMRYARNLAEGQGLVWNAGERVEGYTNFLWTMVMAAVHLTGVADARAALLLRGVSFGFLAASYVLSLRLLRIFAGRSFVASPLLLLAMLTCPDMTLWSVWGFETPLLTFLSLLFLVRALGRGDDAVGYAALSLIPLARGDGIYIFATNAAVALVVSKDRRRAAVLLLAAAVPAVLHLAFRRFYYGDWLPNTYYLKVYGLDNAHLRGYLHARGFLLAYSVILILAAGSAFAILRRDRRGVALFAVVGATLAYVVMTGGDMFAGFRFFAHAMPVIFVFATAGIVTVARRPIARGVWSAVVVLVSVPLLDPLNRLVAMAGNGDPERQLRVAMTIKKNALPESSVVVLCAGVVPYFTRLRAMDMAGKTDRHIARLVPYPGAMIGHGKVDPAYTLGRNPDLVVTCSTGVAAALATTPLTKPYDPLFRMLAAGEFRSRYLPHPVENTFLINETAVYTYPGSREFLRSWNETIEVSP